MDLDRDLDEERGDEFVALLRAAAVDPSTEWRQATERTLIVAPQNRRARLRASVLTAGGLAAVFAAVSLTGGGPLAPGGGDAARAKPGCITVYVTRVEPLGQLRRQADGSLSVETVRQPVTRPVQRCR